MNRNMRECESVETLLMEECPPRKKRAYNNVALKEVRNKQKESFFGKRIERNVIMSPLPEVGTLIKMEEVLQFVRTHEWDIPVQQGYILIPYPHTSHAQYSRAGVTVADDEKVYEVVGYTGDTSNPFKSNLKMRFRNVYPESDFIQEHSVPTRLIACGHIRYRVINSAELKQFALNSEKDVDEN